MDAKDPRSPAVRRGLDRPHQSNAVDLPGSQQPGVPRDDVRRAPHGLRRAGPRAHRRRRRPDPARDDLRHTEREGRHRRDRERLRGEGRPPAADDLVHDHRQERPNALRPDARGVLHVGPPRAAVQHRHQLRARRARHASVSRRPRAHRRVLRQQLPQRRPAQRLRPVRRAPGRDERARPGLRDQRLREHRRRLLWHDPRSHRRDRSGCSGNRTPETILDPRSSNLDSPHRVVRTRTAGNPSRLQLSDDRRADQRHRIRALRARNQGGELHRGRGGRARPGPRRRQHPRRQRRRGHARLRTGDDDVPELHRDGAGDRARADHDRQLQVDRARSGPEVRAGQGGRQFDQPQGGGSGLPRQGANDPALRRGGRRHGVRRDRTGRHGRAESVDLPPGVHAADRAGGRRSLRHHLRPEHPRDRDGARGAQRLRRELHRGDAPHQGDVPGREDQRRRQQPVLLVPRQRHRPRGDALGVPVPRHQGGHGHGHRQRRPARRLRGHSEGPARPRRGRDLQPPAGRDRAARPVRRDGQRHRPQEGSRPRVAKRHRRGAPVVCARPRIGRARRGGRRGGAPQISEAARHHRRAADGRHEDRRGSLRVGKDVPAAGREERARDEEGGRVPRTVHGEREGGADRGGSVGRRHAGADRHGHRERRRARHRQEHRGRRPRLQQLRSHRPRRDGPGGEDPRHRDRAEREHDRPERPHHAVARRDGECRAGDGTAQDEAAAAHRRSHDQPSAHGGQGRARLHAADRPRARCLARGRCRGEPDQPRAPGRLRGQQPRGARGTARELQDARREAAPVVCEGEGESAQVRLGRARHGDALVRGPEVPGRRAARGDCEVHRLDVLLFGVGAEREVPGHPATPAVRRSGAGSVRQRAGAAEADHRREVDPRAGRPRVLAGRGRRRRHPPVQG